jgi:hypothetical protein
VIAVSGGGWGVGDLAGATRAALSIPDATVMCLCGRNDKLRERVARRFAGEPRLKLMGFTDRMGDVLAASDGLVHSSAGLTVLEAIIRGCPVISYGFGYGHVRASNAALERFGLAQVARTEADIGPALERALTHRPDPDGSFARRPSTASLILRDERRARQLPAWRVRTARTITTAATTLAVAGWTLTTGASYKLVSHFVHMRPLTAVSTSRPEVGVLVNAPRADVPTLASALSERGIRVTFALDRPASGAEMRAFSHGDQACPRLGHGGLVRWLGTRDQLRDVLGSMGVRSHFLYASTGPSIGQWWLAHGAGGKLVAGAIRLGQPNDGLRRLRPGQVVELTVTRNGEALPLLLRLDQELRASRLRAVPVGQLVRDAGSSV